MRRCALIPAAILLAACAASVPGNPTPGGSMDLPAATSPAATTPDSATSSAAASVTPLPDAASSLPSGQPTEAPAPTATTSAVQCLNGRDSDAFATALLTEMAERDAGALEARMGSTFKFVIEATDVDVPARRPHRAVRELLTGLRDDGFLGEAGEPRIVPLAAAARVACVHDVPLDRATGLAILGRDYEAAFLATGWGSNGDEEAIVFLDRTRGGRLVWLGLWYSVAGFER